MHHKRISNADWKIKEEKFEKKVELEGKDVVIWRPFNLTKFCSFMLSFYEAPKGVLQKFDFYRSRFFWQGDDHKKKYRLAK
jgi:hypothetical protein